MFFDFKVPVPDKTGNISKRKTRGITYVYYIYERVYDKEKKYNVPHNVIIGKCTDGDVSMMFPNENYLTLFPDPVLPSWKEDQSRSSCVRVGAYIVIRKIIKEYGLDRIADKYIGEDAGLLLDLAAYSVICEDNAGQYYPDYAYNHPLFTDGMHIYSDSKVSTFLKELTKTQTLGFLDEWNESMDHSHKIYVSYDSTNKACDAGDIEIVENGHYKENEQRPIFNYSIAYDLTDRVPLFYEDYPGSIVDISQLRYTIDKAQAYGYKQLGFILDRGYFCRMNLRHIESCGYSFIIMLKGRKELVEQIVREHMGTFEKDRAASIRKFKVNGITVEGKLFPNDEKTRYFHIYYSDRKAVSEREEVEIKIDKLSESLAGMTGKKVTATKTMKKYFDLYWYHEGKEDEALMYAAEKTKVINAEIEMCGYFVIVTSEKMSAKEAITLYKSRDNSEKLFRGDKSYLGNKRTRTHLTETTQAKIFVEFIGLIIRNRIYTALLDEKEKTSNRSNYMNVAAALKELEKIEVIKILDKDYHMDHALTATQKTILKAFGIDAGKAVEMIRDIAKEIPGSQRISE